MGELVTLEQLNAQIESLEAGQLLRLEGVNESIYHASTGYGSSLIKTMANGCPATFKEALNDTFTSTDATDIGSAVHCQILEPFDFEELYIYQPREIKARSGKVWSTFKAKYAGKTILRPTARAIIDGCVDSVLESFGYLFGSGKSEVSYWKRDTEHPSIILKGRMDYEEEESIIDLKTTVDVEPDKFSRQAKSLGYHIQDALYCDITGKNQFQFLAVEKTAPYLTGLFEFSEDMKRLGYLKYRQAVADIAQCLQTGQYPAYTNTTTIIEAAPWDLRELEGMEE